MNNKLFRNILMIVLLLVGVIGFGRDTAHAYTEEQKQQAKAWLSAHGYSPDAGGAAAAYQDYLNGKFDEELGITRETSTQNSSEENEDKKEKTTESDEDDNNEDKTEASSTSVTDIYNTMRNEKITEEQTTEEQSEEITTEKIYQETEDNLEKSEADQEDTTIENDEDIDDETLYDKPADDGNDELFVYIVLGVVAILTAGGIVVLLKDKKNVGNIGEDQQDENL